MPRPDTSPQRREEFAPILARTFADLGYRRATTSELARHCGVQETALYRLWPDKRAMFLAAIEFVHEFSLARWAALLEDSDDDRRPAARILEFEATHHGEFGLYRIVFAGLSETDDAEIRTALRRLYGRIQEFAELQLRASGVDADPELAAWAILGLGTVSNIGRELGLISAATQQRLFRETGRRLLPDRKR